MVFILISGLLTPALADVTDYFTSIKSNPKTLYHFFKKMPKGGELHYHLAGGANAETMISLATQRDYCLEPKTNVVSKTTPCPGVKISTLLHNAKHYRDVVRAWSMQDFFAKGESGHDHFFASFYKFLPIVTDFRPQLLATTMQRAANQHELYLEVMILPDNAYSATFAKQIQDLNGFSAQKQALLANKNYRANVAYTITESKRILSEARKSFGCRRNPQQEVCQLSVKFQYYILREQPIENVFAQALNGFLAASQSSDIVGVNLVQAEDGAISLRDYRAQMKIFDALHKAYPNVNIALHAGELAKSLVAPKDLTFHIHDAILSGHAQRIGHGTDIAYEKDAELLLETMATKPVVIEINLTSSRLILNVAGKQHPLNSYLAHQVPVVLSTDDEGILRTNLTKQYVEAAAQYGLDYPTIRTLNRNALTYSFLPGKSLWANAPKGIVVPECQLLTSPTCTAFINKSEKAKLQWKLEMQLATFEKKFS